MADVYTALVEAGAPDLPEPFFYRVRLNADDSLDLQIRMQNPRIGSRLLRRATVIRRDDEQPIDALARVARRLHEEILLFVEEVDLVGDHFPTSN